MALSIDRCSSKIFLKNISSMLPGFSSIWKHLLNNRFYEEVCTAILRAFQIYLPCRKIWMKSGWIILGGKLWHRWFLYNHTSKDKYTKLENKEEHIFYEYGMRFFKCDIFGWFVIFAYLSYHKKITKNSFPSCSSFLSS